jgi:uncharacterized membrane protein
MLTAVCACALLGQAYGMLGLLNGFSVGVAVIIALLAAAVFAAYPFPAAQPLNILPYFRKYWEIALGGLVYNMAVWVDKWIMWFAPEAVRLKSGLYTYPHYDSAMFVAFLTTVPAMAMFLFKAETHFFERYVRFYRDIEAKATLARIQKNHRSIVSSIYGGFGQFLLLQVSIAAIAILMVPEIIALMRGDHVQIGMLRYGLAGSLFHVLTLFLLILLSYFDSRRTVLYIQCVFLFTNAGFTWVMLSYGFPYYGYGYFLSSFLTFILAVLATTRYVSQLPYHTFITTNTSVKA